MSERRPRHTIGPDVVREGTDLEQAIRILAGDRKRLESLEESGRGDESIPTIYRDTVEQILVSDSVEYETETTEFAYDSATTQYDFSSYDGSVLTQKAVGRWYINSVPAGDTLTIDEQDTAYVRQSDSLQLDGTINLGGALILE